MKKKNKKKSMKTLMQAMGLMPTSGTPTADIVVTITGNGNVSLRTPTNPTEHQKSLVGGIINLIKKQSIENIFGGLQEDDDDELFPDIADTTKKDKKEKPQ